MYPLIIYPLTPSDRTVPGTGEVMVMELIPLEQDLEGRGIPSEVCYVFRLQNHLFMAKSQAPNDVIKISYPILSYSSYLISPHSFILS